MGKVISMEDFKKQKEQPMEDFSKFVREKFQLREHDCDEICYEEESLLTNFDSRQLPIYEKALNKFGDASLYIDNKAYNSQGNLLEGCYALRTKTNQDRSMFWNLFRTIQTQ